MSPDLSFFFLTVRILQTNRRALSLVIVFSLFVLSVYHLNDVVHKARTLVDALTKRLVSIQFVIGHGTLSVYCTMVLSK